jgi:hypothetical protein
LDICGNRLIWIDQKEMKYCNLIEDDLTQLMVPDSKNFGP